MVEAALLRRRGWAVHMVMIDDSYEEFPPTIVDFAIATVAGRKAICSIFGC